MSEKDWWSDAGPYHAWKICPSRPDPVEVLHFYLEKRGIEPAEQIAFLVDLLGLQKSSVYNILKGEGFDSITRCRELVRALKIPPPLLGLDGKYAPIEEHAYWWRGYGFSFHADSQGYPVMSEVVAYLRTHRTQRGNGGRVKTWSQEDLGEATGLKKETIYRMEHDRNPLILESMSRRALVASALGQLSGDDEPMLFRLFGLDPQAYRVPVASHDAVPVIDLPLLTSSVLREYQQKLAAFFMEYATSHAQNAATEARVWVKQFSVLLSRAGSAAQRVDLLALQSRTHRFLACVAGERCEREDILFHTAQALESAEQAMTHLGPRLGSDCALQVTTNELFVSSLWTSALAYYELGEYDVAKVSIDCALDVLQTVQSKHLQAEVLGAACLIHAYTVTSPMDQQEVLSSMHRAVQTHRYILSQVETHDENFFRCDKGTLLLYKAGALSSPKMKGATNERVLDLLSDAQRLTDPTLMRQHMRIEYWQARAYFAVGSHQQAVELALCALEKCRLIRSHCGMHCIEELYQQCLQTSFRDKPLLAYLGMKLRMWDCEIGGTKQC